MGLKLRSLPAIATLLAISAATRAAETVRVNALDCVLNVPSTYEFHVAPASSVMISGSPGVPGEGTIKISALDRTFPSAESVELRQRIVSGPLTVERFTYKPHGKNSSNPTSFTILRGLKQQIEFDDFTDAQVDAYVAQCLESMAPAVTAAAARSAEGCKATLTLNQVIAAMEGEVRPQPVFSGGGLKGWRLYNTSTSNQLNALAIRQGDLMTRVCGVPGGEIFVNDGKACCSVDVSHEFEATFERGGHELKVLIKRKP